MGRSSLVRVLAYILSITRVLNFNPISSLVPENCIARRDREISAALRFSRVVISDHKYVSLEHKYVTDSLVTTVPAYCRYTGFKRISVIVDLLLVNDRRYTHTFWPNVRMLNYRSGFESRVPQKPLRIHALMWPTIHRFRLRFNHHSSHDETQKIFADPKLSRG